MNNKQVEIEDCSSEDKKSNSEEDYESFKGSIKMNNENSSEKYQQLQYSNLS